MTSEIRVAPRPKRRVRVRRAFVRTLRSIAHSVAEERGVPPYVIFHDSTLQEMCISLPQDMDQFGELSGVGQRKLERYGPAFLKVLQDHVS